MAEKQWFEYISMPVPTLVDTSTKMTNSLEELYPNNVFEKVAVLNTTDGSLKNGGKIRKGEQHKYN